VVEEEVAVRDAALQESHMEKRELRRQLSTKETEVQATAIEVRCATKCANNSSGLHTCLQRSAASGRTPHCTQLYAVDSVTDSRLTRTAHCALR
jgi:hypothetical protein